MAESDGLARRILILAPVGRDAEFTRLALANAALEAEVTGGMDELCLEIGRGAGAVIVTAEAMNAEALRMLSDTLEGQPAWSELPIVVFLSEGLPRNRSSPPFQLPRAQVTLVDRPVHLRTLVSIAESALQSRQRQYEIAALLTRLEASLENERRHADRLAGLAEASLSIASALSLADVLKMITEQARKVIGSELAVTRVLVNQERGEALTSISHSEMYKAWETYFREQADQLANIVQVVTAPVRLSTSKPASTILHSVFEESDLRPRVKGLLAAPLIERDGRNIGFIALSNKKDGDFTPDDEPVLVQLAQMASAAVQNARLYREAQDANRAKDDFLATLAHELRTPMTAILGWVQMLKDPDLNNKDVHSAIDMIEASTRVQARLVEDLLDVSRIIAGKLKLSPEKVELAPLVESVAETFRAGAAERQVTLTTNVESEPLSIWGDPTRLQQVIWNLLSNSIKFTSAGGTVALTVHREDREAVLSVSDTGQGIDPAFLPHVFERFRQAETGTTRGFGGLGLGLAIVRHLVESHGGRVEAHSDGVGKGARFTVRLPLMAILPEQLERLAIEASSLSGRKVLIVDDDFEARRALASLLESFGVLAKAVGSVQEAFHTLRSFDAELVISDIAMPGEDGYALVRRLREFETELGKGIPALALTGYGRPEDRMKILSAGFQRYVQKPVTPAELAQIAADLINS